MVWRNHGKAAKLLAGPQDAFGIRNQYIKAVCSFYGPADLTTMLPPAMRNQRTNAVAALLGGPVSDKLKLAREASPITYASQQSPPVLIFQGLQDRLVPASQSMALNAALKAAGAQSTLVLYQDNGHAFGPNEAALREIEHFFRQALSLTDESAK